VRGKGPGQAVELELRSSGGNLMKRATLSPSSSVEGGNVVRLCFSPRSSRMPFSSTSTMFTGQGTKDDVPPSLPWRWFRRMKVKVVPGMPHRVRK